MYTDCNKTLCLFCKNQICCLFHFLWQEPHLTCHTPPPCTEATWSRHCGMFHGVWGVCMTCAIAPITSGSTITDLLFYSANSDLACDGHKVCPSLAVQDSLITLQKRKGCFLPVVVSVSISIVHWNWGNDGMVKTIRSLLGLSTLYYVNALPLLILCGLKGRHPQ